MRFACEAAFLVLVAVGAALMELRPLAIIILMGCAWLLVALIERASSRETARAVFEAGEQVPMPESTLEHAAWQSVEPREAYRWLFWRRSRARLEELPSPTAALEERPARSHVRRIEPRPEPVATLEPEPAAPLPPVEPEPQLQPGPAVTKRPLELPGLEEAPAARSAPPQRPRFLRPRQPAPVPAGPPPAPPAREWNIWELERRARQQARNAARDEEWSALFTHLRVFANADGVLPKEFDELVRESFGTLIEAA